MKRSLALAQTALHIFTKRRFYWFLDLNEMHFVSAQFDTRAINFLPLPARHDWGEGIFEQKNTLLSPAPLPFS
jgi:hypothetical protein